MITKMVSKIDKIKKVIGEYFDYDGVTYHYFMDEIEKIKDKKQ